MGVALRLDVSRVFLVRAGVCRGLERLLKYYRGN